MKWQSTFALVMTAGAISSIFTNVVVNAKTVGPIKITIGSTRVPNAVIVPSQKISTPNFLTVEKARKLFADQIDEYISQGTLVATSTLLSFEKMYDLNRSFSEEKTGFQPYYLPAAAVAGVGTFVSATNVSGDSVTGNNLNGTNTTADTLAVSALATFSGGLYLATPETGNAIDTDTGATLSGGGDWTNASSRDLKENFATLDPFDILAKINSLTISRWNYKKEASSTTHIGPLAEDFAQTFGVGGQKSISTIDPAGVAILGIQALSKQVDELTKQVQEIRQSICVSASPAIPNPVTVTIPIEVGVPAVSEIVTTTEPTLLLTPDTTEMSAAYAPTETVTSTTI